MSKRWLTAVVAVSALLACSEPTRLTGPLSFDEQVKRMQACNRLFREAGGFRVMHFPGGSTVRGDEWIELTRAEQTELVDLTTCIATRGEVEPVDIEIVDLRARRVLLRRHVANNRDFAAMVR